MLLKKSKPHGEKVLNQLKKSGKYGVFGHDLAKQNVGGWRFGEYIRQLRSKGHVIDTVRISGNTTKYYLRTEKEYNEN